MLATNHSIEMDSFLSQEEVTNVFQSNSSSNNVAAQKRDYAIGIGLILIVASLYTLSGFLTQASTSIVFFSYWAALHCFNRTYIKVAMINRSCKPKSFVFHSPSDSSTQDSRLTYMNVGTHSLCLIPFLLLRWWNRSRRKRYVTKL